MKLHAEKIAGLVALALVANASLFADNENPADKTPVADVPATPVAPVVAPAGNAFGTETISYAELYLSPKTQLPPFTSRAAKAGRVIINKYPGEIAQKIAEVAPTEKEPFKSGVKVRYIRKQMMLHPQLTKAQERRAAVEKAEREEKRKKERADREAAEAKARAKKPTAEEKVELERNDDLGKFLQLSPREIVKHPTAPTFPGDVPESVQRVNKSYTSDNEIRGWQCTGLYAPPGEIIRVHIAKAGVNSGYKIRVGIHTDDLREGNRKPIWSRFPAITREFSVPNDTIEIANPFGGMIYVFAPEPPKKKKIVTSSQARIPQRVRFQFIGIVEAPVFKLGETKPGDWNYLKDAPAPWAEFAGKYFTATIPSSAVREMKNPTELISFWDKIIEDMEKLAGIKKTRIPADRIVFDADSTGHAGHHGTPIVCSLALLKTFTDIEYIRQNGSWGLFFFLAKNRVNSAWSLYGNSDAAAAILALRSMQLATGKKPSAFFDIAALNASALSEPKLAGTPELIGAYAKPIDELGWDPLYKTFDTYNNAKKPLSATDIDKYESLFSLWSRNAKTNLATYFESFGFDYTDRQKTRLEKKFKKYAPKNFPPQNAGAKTNPSGFIGDMPLGNIDCFFSDYNSPDVEFSPLDMEDADEIDDGGEEEEVVKK